MSTDFSRGDHKTPSNRFRAGPGMVGAEAGLRAGRAPSGGGGPTRPPRRGAPDRGSRGGGLGLPQMPAEPDKPTDLRHLIALAQHKNMRSLGRDAPLGIQLINNGDFRQLFEPGRVPFDWFWDT